MLVRDRKTAAAEVTSIPQSWRLKADFLWERGVIWLANGLSKRNLFQVDIANAGTDITSMDAFRWADVIHLHWVNQGFLSLGILERIMASGKPVVMTMHDQWYFTGICHYSGDCDKYQSQCRHCPSSGGGTASTWHDACLTASGQCIKAGAWHLWAVAAGWPTWHAGVR